MDNRKLNLFAIIDAILSVVSYLLSSEQNVGKLQYRIVEGAGINYSRRTFRKLGLFPKKYTTSFILTTPR